MVLGQGRKGRQGTESHIYVTHSIRFIQIICAFKVECALEKKEMLFWEQGNNKANRFASLMVSTQNSKPFYREKF